MSEHAHYYDTFRARVATREFCGGEACRGWFLSEVDTWHECPCNGAKGYGHPEDESDVVYVVTLTGVPVATSYRKDVAQRWTRKVATRRGSPDGLRIARIQGVKGLFDRLEGVIDLTPVASGVAA